MEIKVFNNLAILIITTTTTVTAICGVCQTNGVACINKTSYQFCFGDSRPHSKQTFNCLEGFDCTDLPNICFQSGGWIPSCEDLSKCGVCNANRVFACTSRTTFAFCFGSYIPTNVKGKCPNGYICDLTSSFICVRHDSNNIKPSCDIAE